ncbi:hypothetical protein BC941DRAFT_515031 [Chlamydoabsidia padenii]|nr:hypothetical protein BC941DRAFT_515031 [Chlamydoabsidia padenii]
MYNQWISTVMSKIDCSPSDRAALPAPSSSSHFDDQKRVKDHLFPENHQQEKINSNQSVNKDLLQKGLTIMQLAIIEPQEQASMALYAIALDKFISAEQGADSHKNPSWLSLLNGQTPNRCSMNTKSFNEKTIWSQLLRILIFVSIRKMILFEEQCFNPNSSTTVKNQSTDYTTHTNSNIAKPNIKMANHKSSTVYLDSYQRQVYYINALNNDKEIQGF